MVEALYDVEIIYRPNILLMGYAWVCYIIPQHPPVVNFSGQDELLAAADADAAALRATWAGGVDLDDVIGFGG